MARWYVVTEGPTVPVGRVVAKVLEREDLEDGRCRWLVEAPDFVRALPSCFKGFLIVEPACREDRFSDRFPPRFL